MRATDPAPASSAERDFIELATRSLEDHPELRDETRGELMARLSQGLPAGDHKDAILQAAQDRLARSRPRSRKATIAAAILVWLLLACCVAWQASRIHREYRKEVQQISRAEEEPARLKPGDPRLPTDPVEFGERLADPDLHSISDGSYRHAWKQVDPDNGAWAWREAEERTTIGWGHNSDHAEDIKTWRLVEEATAAPRFEIHSSKARAARLIALGEPETGVGLFTRLGRHQVFPTPISRTHNPFTYFADRMAETKDPEGLSRGIRIWEKICMRHIAEFSAAEDLGIIRSLCNAGDQLTTAAMVLGMRAEADKLLRQTTAMARSDVRHFALTKKDPRMGVMACRNLHLGPSPGSDAYLPGRMMEYALAERMLALMAAAILLLVVAAAGLESLCRTRRVKALASGLAPLFDWRDRAWVISLGVLLPPLWYAVITRLTPLGERDYPIFDHYYGIRVPFQATAMVVLMLVMIVQTGLWRISRRSAFLDLAPRPWWLGWVMAAIATALLPLVGLIPSQIVGGIAGLPLLWLFWQAGAVLIAPGANALLGVMLSRTILPPLLTAAPLMLGCYFALLAEEKSWMTKDQLTAWDAARGMSKQEAKSIDWVITSCREAFDDEDAASPQK